MRQHSWQQLLETVLDTKTYEGVPLSHQNITEARIVPSLTRVQHREDQSMFNFAPVRDRYSLHTFSFTYYPALFLLVR